MESMDYNYFANGPHSFTYINYGADANLMHSGVSGDVNGAVSSGINLVSQSRGSKSDRRT